MGGNVRLEREGGNYLVARNANIEKTRRHGRQQRLSRLHPTARAAHFLLLALHVKALHCSRGLAIVATLFCVAVAQADEGIQHVLGTITSIEGQTLYVRTVDGKRVIVRVDGQTRYVRAADGAPGAEWLKSGVRVAVEAVAAADGMLAREVKIGVVEHGAASAKSSPRAGHEEHAATEGSPAEQLAPAHAGHGAEPEPLPQPSADDHAAQGHPQGATSAPPEEHGEHAMGPSAAHRDGSRDLFESDMSRMAGMGPHDPMQGMDRPGWTWMTLATARLLYNHQGGRSGESAVESSNWTMVMAQRRVGSGLVTLMSMNSFEPATVGEGGSPQLFQTGESFKGRPLVDRQHPHDFFMNLAATYRRPVGKHGAAWLQLAPIGEPALGPTAFMHRASAGENPTSPLGHHWQDSTHITRTVVTAGGAWKRLVLEASAFHGQEPDEARWNIDIGSLDSASARVKLLVSDGWLAQFSHAFVKEPERLEPGNLRRTTASIHYGAAGDRPLAASIVWGRNREQHGISDTFLLEAAYQLRSRDHLFARLESVEKDMDLLETKSLEDEHHDDNDSARIVAATVGYLRDLAIFERLRAGVGADFTAYRFPAHLRAAYGEDPLSFHVFLRLRWNEGHARQHSGH